MQDALLNFPSELHKAAFNTNLDDIQKNLHEHGYSPEKDSLEQTPLILLVRARADDADAAQRIADAASLFIQHKADVNTPDKYGDSPLILAVMDGGGVPKTETVRALVEAGADVKAVCENFKMTPLHWAAVIGATDIAKVLVDAGARLNKIDRNRETPLQVARRQLKRLQDGIDHFGNEYAGDDKAKRIGRYTDFIDYLESLAGIKKDDDDK